MKRASLAAILILAALASRLWAAYSYYYSCDAFDCGTWSTDWTINGLGYQGGGGTFSNGSAISTRAVPDGSSDYEVKTVLNVGSGEQYHHYLRATSGAQYNVNNGLCYESFYAVVITSSNVSIIKCNYYSLSWLASSSLTNGYGTWQSVMSGSSILVFKNGTLVLTATDSALTTGKPGIGGAGAFIASYLGPLDRIAPNQVNSFLTTPFPNYVDLQWAPTADDANGTGVVSYEISRNGTYLGETPNRTFTDSTVSPGTNYTYTVRARDRHYNLSTATNASITTPGSGAIDARRIGVRGDGSYWGGAGEQMDMLSGNLNYTLPLVKAEGRGGWGVSFVLNYNSQNWRKDNGMWKLGGDVGYGFGWRLMAGALTPVFSNLSTVHHYVFTDASGAEYRLGINSGGIWTSAESTYVKYDANQAKLFFTDGSMWEMGCLSAGTEQDAGTRYPTRMEDTSGNTVEIFYQGNSARISMIRDARLNADQLGWGTYQFSYNSDPIPHLTQIINNIGTAEAYTFSYTTAATLYAPFSPQTSFGSAQMLQTVTRSGLSLSHTFEYGSNGSGELTKVILPFGGDIRWTYGDFAYTGGRTYREVVSRQLVKQSGATPTTYPITRPSGDSALYAHSQAVLSDPGGVGQRAWNFSTTAGYTMGLVTSYEQRQLPGPVVKAKDDYTWAQDSGGRPYIGVVLSTLDPGTGSQKQSKTEQTVDAFGNVTQTKLYGYGSLVTPARTYTNSYLTTGTYPTYHLNNRLVSSVLTDGTTSVTLVSNTYDGGTAVTLPTTPHRWNASHAGPAGRVTQSLTPGATRNITYYQTGTVATQDDGLGHSVSVTPSQAALYTRPSTVTPNSNGAMSENFTWNRLSLGCRRRQVRTA